MPEQIARTFVELIIERETLTGRTIMLPIPGTCAAIWRQAHQRLEVPVGDLAVVSEPLLPGAGGQARTETGDVWILAEAEEGKTIGRLLHELAHLQRLSGQPATVTADWEEEIATFEEAQRLAEQWGVAHLVPVGWFEEQIAWNWSLLEFHEQAALLAGTADPALARCAFVALEVLGAQHQWTVEQVEAALFGILGQDPALDAVFFDRSCLRRSWRLTYGMTVDFGPAEIAPSHLSVALLREALEFAAKYPIEIPHPWGEHDLLLPPFQADQLRTSVGILNALLLDEDDRTPCGLVQVYGGATGRLYHLTLSFDDHLTKGREVWVWATGWHERDRAAEAGLQGYLRSWRTIPVRYDGDLALGMTLLFESLATMSAYLVGLTDRG